MNPAAKYNAKSQILVSPGSRTFRKTPKTMIYIIKVMRGLITDQYNPKSEPTYFEEISRLIKLKTSPRYFRIWTITVP
jgi:hypothetical protein